MGVIPTGALSDEAGGGSPLLRASMAPTARNPGGPSSSSAGCTTIPGEWTTTAADPGLVTPRGSVAGAWAKQPALVVRALGMPYNAERRSDLEPQPEEPEETYEEAVESEAKPMMVSAWSPRRCQRMSLTRRTEGAQQRHKTFFPGAVYTLLFVEPPRKLHTQLGGVW